MSATCWSPANPQACVPAFPLVEQFDDIADDRQCVRCARVRCEVGRQQHVVHLEQWGGRRDRLDSRRRAPAPAMVPSIRAFSMAACCTTGPRGVDEHGRWFHEFEFALTDQARVLGLRSQCRLTKSARLRSSSIDLDARVVKEPAEVLACRSRGASSRRRVPGGGRCRCCPCR